MVAQVQGTRKKFFKLAIPLCHPILKTFQGLSPVLVGYWSALQHHPHPPLLKTDPLGPGNSLKLPPLQDFYTYIPLSPLGEIHFPQPSAPDPSCPSQSPHLNIHSGGIPPHPWPYCARHASLSAWLCLC